MAVKAVEGYNERIKDAILLAFGGSRVEALGLARYFSREPV